MKLELVNPSDKIFFEADDELTAFLTVILLGDGKYGANDEYQKTIVPVLIFGWRDYFKEKFGGEPEVLLEKNKEKIKKCLKSFKIEGERTSLNNICKIAEGMSKEL